MFACSLLLMCRKQLTCDYLILPLHIPALPRASLIQTAGHKIALTVMLSQLSNRTRNQIKHVYFIPIDRACVASLLHSPLTEMHSLKQSYNIDTWGECTWHRQQLQKVCTDCVSKQLSQCIINLPCSLLTQNSLWWAVPSAVSEVHGSDLLSA